MAFLGDGGGGTGSFRREIMDEQYDNRPIGVFDSGVGGLTVLDAIQQALPHEELIYLGDTARVPYGNRTPQTIIRYATSCARQLMARGVKTIVIACNTASAHALEALNETFDIPVFGVIEPASRMAVQVSRNHCIGVVGTRATITSRAYSRAIHQMDSGAYVCGHPCPLFVPLVEEGWANTEVARLVVTQYLRELLALMDGHEPDTLILGCTHYPVLKQVIADTLSVTFHKKVHLCDPAEATASELTVQLQKSHLLASVKQIGKASYLVTDDPVQFSAVGKSFMKSPPEDVKHIDIL